MVQPGGWGGSGGWSQGNDYQGKGQASYKGSSSWKGASTGSWKGAATNGWKGDSSSTNGWKGDSSSSFKGWKPEASTGWKGDSSSSWGWKGDSKGKGGDDWSWSSSWSTGKGSGMFAKGKFDGKGAKGKGKGRSADLAGAKRYLRQPCLFAGPVMLASRRACVGTEFSISCLGQYGPLVRASDGFGVSVAAGAGARRGLRENGVGTTANVVGSTNVQRRAHGRLYGTQMQDRLASSIWILLLTNFLRFSSTAIANP